MLYTVQLYFQNVLTYLKFLCNFSNRCKYFIDSIVLTKVDTEFIRAVFVFRVRLL